MPRTKKAQRSSRARTHQKSPRSPRSYTPLADALNQPFTFADTEIAAGIQRHSLAGSLASALSRQRRADAEPLPRVLCALLIWPLLKVKSIHCFCAELCQFLSGKVSVLYDFMGREDINWRGLFITLVRKIFAQNDLGPCHRRALVVDDTSQARAGRKVQGTSSYYDHTQNRTRHGHQLLQLGLAGEQGFLPLLCQLVMGEKSPVDKPQDKPFKDQRSAAARDLRRAQDLNKQQGFRELIHRAVNLGFTARYVLADAWFGCKENILCARQNQLIAIFQMKRGNLTYKHQGQTYTATQLYAKVQRRMRPASAKARYKTASLVVSINLQTQPQEPPQWVKVRLVFSAPVRNCSADTWVVFLCSDETLKDAAILETYALRWSIEVYFKELKQNLGFLKEQSGRYELAYASVYLSAIRYVLLFEAMLRNGQLNYGEIRDRQTGQLQVLTYASLLWQWFRALIAGALEGLVEDFGRKVIQKLLATIDQTVEAFLNDALQISPEHVAAQLKAEELGYL